ncbi:LysR family transcriptional regulator [Gilvimarinus sp. F26214L]|uniref:LysR family transcriptional regulator n=1 Tax=Gilvimarinus sp. DZF01 TaxID=3461371 RepID=UPI004045C050
MTLDDLEVFVAAAQAENLSAVARNLGCTQPAVSQHIVRLEKELGSSLLERRPRGVALTQAGRIFYEHALEALEAIEFGVRGVQRLRAGDAGRLSICTGGTTVRHLMKDTVARFRSAWPRVELLFHSANSHQRCIEALRNEKADLAFVTIGAPVRGLEQHPALTVPWVLVVPEDDPLGRVGSITTGDLNALSFIRLKESSTSQAQLEEALSKEGVRLQSSAQVDDWDTAILFVGMGLGYAITPAIHAQRLAARDRVRALDIVGLPPVVFGWALRRWSNLPRMATDFMETFARACAEEGALNSGPAQPPTSEVPVETALDPAST